LTGRVIKSGPTRLRRPGTTKINGRRNACIRIGTSGKPLNMLI
jgi:hypothetical protein